MVHIIYGLRAEGLHVEITIHEARAIENFERACVNKNALSKKIYSFSKNVNR